MPAGAGRKKGAPKAKSSSERGGFYTRVLDEADLIDFEMATGVEGIDDEIALLRVKIKSILSSDPDNIKLIMQITDALSRLVRTRYNITKDQKKGLKEAIANVIGDIAVPLGIGIGAAFDK